MEEKKGILDRAKGKIALALVAITGLTGGSVAMATANAAEKTPSATASATRPLGPNALKKLCVRAGLKMPIVGERAEGNSGQGDMMWDKGSKMKQSVLTAQRFGLVPDECNGEYNRKSYLLPQVQDPYNHRRWYVLSPPFERAYGRGHWQRVWSGNRGYGNRTDNHYVEKYDALARQIFSNPIHSNQLYRCTPGPRKTRVRYMLQNEVIDQKTGNRIAKRRRNFPVKVRGGAC